MKVFICGGGSGKQTVRALRRLNEVIDHTLPCLYIPLAMEPEHYDSCGEWITGELDGVDIPGIEMVRSAEELARKRLADYSFLFIGGGNTFRLLHEIRRVNMFEPIRAYLQSGGAAFGGSAGAIIFGEDLEACALDDENEVGLRDTRGFDVMGGVSFLCHFTNRSPEQDRRSEAYLLKISARRKVYALPEEDTLFVNESGMEAIIDRPYYIFENGRKTEVSPGGRTGESTGLREISFYRPEIEDLWFREALLADPETMSYNNAWGGTIPFPREEWEEWYDGWVRNPVNRYYRYIRAGKDGPFVGEAAWHLVEQQLWLTDVIIASGYRRQGYGSAALRLLCEEARKAGIPALYDNIAPDNPGISLFLQNGFREEYRNEECIMLKKVL